MQYRTKSSVGRTHRDLLQIIRKTPLLETMLLKRSCFTFLKKLLLMPLGLGRTGMPPAEKEKQGTCKIF